MNNIPYNTNPMNLQNTYLFIENDSNVYSIVSYEYSSSIRNPFNISTVVFDIVINYNPNIISHSKNHKFNAYLKNQQILLQGCFITEYSVLNDGNMELSISVDNWIAEDSPSWLIYENRNNIINKLLNE